MRLDLMAWSMPTKWQTKVIDITINVWILEECLSYINST